MLKEEEKSMLNKKTKGIVIIAIVLFAIFYVAKINVKMKELEKDNQALRNKQTEIEQSADEEEEVVTEESTTQATTEEVTAEEVTTEEVITTEETTEVETTEEEVVNNGVDLLSIHTIIGDTSDYFEESRGVMDNVGNTHEHAYYIYRFFRYDGDDEEEEYSIVGSMEADPFLNKISNESPIGKAIMNRRVGDIIGVESPNGSYDIKIVKIA